MEHRLQRPSCKTQKVQQHLKFQLQNGISTPKQKKDDFEALFKRILERKIKSAKIAKIANKSLSQPGCSHSNTIYEI